MYYEMSASVDPETTRQAIQFWLSTGQYEPSILERIVAFTYLLSGGERLWISRLYTTLFWCIGGIALFALGLRMARSDPLKNQSRMDENVAFGSALIALTYYLILPFGVQASRSFQPDPGMVMWIMLSIYALYRWAEKQDWKWAIFAGLLAGMAVITKAVAAYFVAGASIAMVIHTLGFKKTWRNLQVWTMALLMVTPTVVFYMGRGGRASEYLSSWTVSLSHLLAQPSFYMRWLNLVQNLMGLTILMLGLLGVLISTHRNRALLIGLWGGYALYGLTLPYQMYTHNYYHLAVIPILSISLIPVSESILRRILQQGRIWQTLCLGVVLMAIIFTSWQAIFPQYTDDYRNEPPYWSEITSYLPSEGKIIALTQDYGYRLMYYGWRKVTLWPNRGEQKLMNLRGSEKEFEQFFAKRTEDKSYFLITAFSQFNDQPALQKYLAENYPVLVEGDGYLIYDLREPVVQ
jgi:4-amino-4-deoxy-L-arabinose transferase-like glycosyltransferase